MLKVREITPMIQNIPLLALTRISTIAKCFFRLSQASGNKNQLLSELSIPMDLVTNGIKYAEFKDVLNIGRCYHGRAGQSFEEHPQFRSDKDRFNMLRSGQLEEPSSPRLYPRLCFLPH